LLPYVKDALLIFDGEKRKKTLKRQDTDVSRYIFFLLNKSRGKPTQTLPRAHCRRSKPIPNPIVEGAQALLAPLPVRRALTYHDRSHLSSKQDIATGQHPQRITIHTPIRSTHLLRLGLRLRLGVQGGRAQAAEVEAGEVLAAVAPLEVVFFLLICVMMWSIGD
jgi:hypothetical protein